MPSLTLSLLGSQTLSDVEALSDGSSHIKALSDVEVFLDAAAFRTSSRMLKISRLSMLLKAIIDSS